jgi:hypothetical protein
VGDRDDIVATPLEQVLVGARMPDVSLLDVVDITAT